jgi:predicted nucleic acid-binding protein
MEEDSNATQTWKRLKDNAITAITDIILLAEKLPNDKQEEIFNIHNIDKLANSILFPLRKDFDYDEDDSRRTRLAAILAEKGIRKCISQYSRITRPEFSEDQITGLRKSISKCNEIALQVELRKAESRNIKLRYLFDWNKVFDSDGNNELKQFLKDKYNQDWVEDVQVERSKDNKTIYINHTRINNSNSISITLADDKTNANLLICDADGKKIVNRNLIVKDNDGNISVYYKRNKRRKKKTENNEDTRPPAFFTFDY